MTEYHKLVVGHAFDIYFGHRCYPTLIDRIPQRLVDISFERNGWISGHVEYN